jgi:hypothetical protein
LERVILEIQVPDPGGLYSAVRVFPVVGRDTDGLSRASATSRTRVYPAFWQVAMGLYGAAQTKRRKRRGGWNLAYAFVLRRLPARRRWPLWMNYVANGKPSQGQLVGIGIALVPCLLLVAWAAYTFWDEPIGKWLRARLLQR